MELMGLMHQRIMAIDAPCRSAFASRLGAENINAARHVGCARPVGARLPTPVILRGFAACQSVSKAYIGSNTTCVHTQSQYHSVSKLEKDAGLLITKQETQCVS